MADHLLAPRKEDLTGVHCPCVKGRERIQQSYAQYLADESRLQGDLPERLYFPTTTIETAAALSEIHQRGECVTISGARTGIAGGAANRSAANLLSLERLTQTPRVRYHADQKTWCVHAAAGMTLRDLQEALRQRTYRAEERPPDLFYPVDPTETSASLGGTVATNASGARTLYHGPTRSWVLGLTLVFADGRVLQTERSRGFARAGTFLWVDSEGVEREVRVPGLRMPDTKHVAGYYVSPDMDLLDLFVGGEGTLAVVTEMVLRLCERPAECLYLTVFMTRGDRSIELVQEIKGAARLKPVALEYMDQRSVDLLLDFRKEQAEASGVLPLPAGTEAILYMEIAFDGEAGLETLYAEVEQILGRYGISTESTWAGFTHRDLEAMKKLRHALPERVNSIIAQRKASVPGLTKVGTDMAVPDEALPEMMDTYRRAMDREKLQYVIFGHIGNGHLHVNILPRTLEELKAGKRTYVEFARKAVSLGGSVAAEHGIGKLKREFLRIQYGREEIEQMIAMRRAFDPEGTLNPGVLWETGGNRPKQKSEEEERTSNIER